MARKLLLVELNEITWDLVDPLIAQGKLPTFAKLKREGSWGTSVAIEVPPQLDPWVTWTTLYTGRPQEDHNVFFLQQPPESIHAPRIWEICAQHGLSVGVYGSVCTWPPPKNLDGFYVPDTFSPDTSTYPESLEPIQRMNLTYTRTVRLPSDQDGMGFKVKLGMNLMRLGLGASSIANVGKQLFSEMGNPGMRWKRVALQPMINFRFFRRLYQKHHPQFACFHSNHVAHYQHTYWKAMQPDRFKPLETSAEERETYGKAIEYGYQVADQLLQSIFGLLDSNTVLVLASSMGQKPYISQLEGGKQVQQLRSHAKLLEILGAKDRARAVSTMSDEFTIYPESAADCDDLYRSLEQAWVVETGKQLFIIQRIENSIRVNLHFYSKTEVTGNSPICFPLAPGAPRMSYEELIYNTGHLKSGCHDPRGVIAFYGPGVPAGLKMADYSNLDFAPTFLKMLGLPEDPKMRGRVMEEVLEPAPVAKA